MLVSMKAILDHANQGYYAVPAPNIFSELDARAALETAEDMNAPIILDVSFNQNPDLVLMGSFLVRLAEQAAVPVAINLDHGGADDRGDLYEALVAIKAGFTSVMCDRSQYPFDENVRQVKRIVEIAHPLGITVEAELGHVGHGIKYESDSSAHLTDAREAKRYIEETRVDALAVAIGNAHGSYGGHTPKLDFDRLVEIKETVKIPLVLHGGSGTGDENIQKACTLGINKVNLLNELLQNAVDAIQSEDMQGNKAYKLFDVLLRGWKGRLATAIEITGCKDKAWEVESPGLGCRREDFFSEKREDFEP